MAEWSRAPANSPREQGGVGSKPTPGKKLFFALYFLFYYTVHYGLFGKTDILDLVKPTFWIW